MKKAIVWGLLTMMATGCATKDQTPIREMYRIPEGPSDAVTKVYDTCDQEARQASRGTYIAAWATIPLTLVFLPLVMIPVGLAMSAASNVKDARDACMAKAGYPTINTGVSDGVPVASPIDPAVTSR